MRILLRVFPFIHGLLATLFACAAVMLLVIAAKASWGAFADGLTRIAAQNIIEAVYCGGRRASDRANHRREEVARTPMSVADTVRCFVQIPRRHRGCPGH
jgi:hypothetical protein